MLIEHLHLKVQKYKIFSNFGQRKYIIIEAKLS